MNKIFVSRDKIVTDSDAALVNGNVIKLLNSDIYSLEEYNTRFDQKIDKAYLEGRYGGVPIFSTVFPIEGEV